MGITTRLWANTDVDSHLSFIAYTFSAVSPFHYISMTWEFGHRMWEVENKNMSKCILTNYTSSVLILRSNNSLNGMQWTHLCSCYHSCERGIWFTSSIISWCKVLTSTMLGLGTIVCFKLLLLQPTAARERYASGHCMWCSKYEHCGFTAFPKEVPLSEMSLMSHLQTLILCNIQIFRAYL